MRARGTAAHPRNPRRQRRSSWEVGPARAADPMEPGARTPPPRTPERTPCGLWVSGASCDAENRGERAGKALPALTLIPEMLHAGVRQGIHLRAAAFFGRRPRRLDQAAALEAV